MALIRAFVLVRTCVDDSTFLNYFVCCRFILILLVLCTIKL